MEILSVKIQKLHKALGEMAEKVDELERENSELTSVKVDLENEVSELEERVSELENADIEQVTFCGVEIGIECDNMAVKSFLDRFIEKHAWSNINQLEILI